YAKLDRHAEAIEDYGRALEARPKDDEKALLYRFRGREYLASNALQPALRDFEQALHLDPDSADAHLGCALVRVKLGDLHQGLTEAEKALKDEPKEPRLWHEAARVYAQAIAHRKAEPSQDARQAALRTRYQERAFVLLRTAFNLVP